MEWNKTRTKSYTYYKGSITHNGKVLSPKKFKTQEEAALYVNYLIDKYKPDAIALEELFFNNNVTL